MSKVTVYTKDYCTYCAAAKALLTDRGIAYDEVDLSKQGDDEWQALQKRSGMRTVPQIFSGEKLIGGFSELSKLDKEDKLVSLK